MLILFSINLVKLQKEFDSSEIDMYGYFEKERVFSRYKQNRNLLPWQFSLHINSYPCSWFDNFGYTKIFGARSAYYMHHFKKINLTLGKVSLEI